MSTPIVLVVEDNEIEQYALKLLLAKFDYDARAVSSGEDAILALGASVYAAVLMDLQLPGMDGWECTERIRAMELQSGRRTPVIALTASGDWSDIARSLAAGMDDHLIKPADPEALRKVLLRHVYDSTKPNLKTLKPLPPFEIDYKLPA